MRDVGNRLAAHISYFFVGSIVSLALRKSNCVLAQAHILSNAVNPNHGLAFRTEQGEVDQDGILLDPCSCFPFTDRTRKPVFPTWSIHHDIAPSFFLALYLVSGSVTRTTYW